MIFLLFLTLHNLNYQHAALTLLKSPKSVFLDWNGTKLLLELLPEDFMSIQFDTFLILDLKYTYYIVNVTAKFHNKHVITNDVFVKHISPHGSKLPCTSEDNIELMTFTGICHISGRFVEVTSKEPVKLLNFDVYGEDIYSEIYSGCYEYVSTGTVPRKIGNLWNSFKICKTLSIPYLIIRNDSSYQCLSDLTELIPRPAKNCEFTCFPRLACGTSIYFALYHIAAKISDETITYQCWRNAKHCKKCEEGFMGMPCVIRNCRVKNGGCGDYACEVMNTSTNSFSYCTCHKSYEPFYCHVEGIDCKSNDICDKNSSSCTEVDGDVSCECLNGFKKFLNQKCQDIDECNDIPESCRGNGSVCRNFVGSFQCACRPGFYKQDKSTCRDKNECDDVQNVCDLKTTRCVNLPGSYSCDCLDGYQQKDYYSCKDINECSSNLHDCNHTFSACVNLEGSYKCDCSMGPAGIDLNCKDIDECANKDICKARATVCRNIYGSYICECLRGFQRLNNQCRDMDECSSDTHKCGKHSTCTNTVGSYKCSCRRGLVLTNHTTHYTCEDLNECSRQNVCNPRTSVCVNVYEGYSCHCRPGFVSYNKYNCKRAHRATAGTRSTSSDYYGEFGTALPITIINAIRSNVMFVYFSASAFPFVSLLAYLAFKTDNNDFSLEEAQLDEENQRNSMSENESEYF